MVIMMLTATRMLTDHDSTLYVPETPVLFTQPKETSKIRNQDDHRIENLSIVLMQNFHTRLQS